MNSLFNMAMRYNDSLAGGSAVETVRQMDEQLQLFSDLPANPDMPVMEDLGRRIFMTELVGIASKNEDVRKDARRLEKHQAAVSTYLIARREVVREKLDAGVSAEQLQGQPLQREIDAKLRQFHTLYTENWRPGPCGYKKKVSPATFNLMVELNGVLTRYYAATTFTFSGVNSKRAMTKPRDFDHDGHVHFYSDDFRRVIRNETGVERSF